MALKRRKRTLAAVKVGIIALVLLTGAVVALSAYNQRLERAYDLSVVGQGVPVVVQVHDPDCPFCVELRRNVESITGEFDSRELLIRYAELPTSEGAAFARLYGAERVTLLFFDAQGELKAHQAGVQEPEQLRRTFRRLAAGEL
ncbi:MAG: thioredoxin family protein [Spirochaetaceae bacterium]|nr:MAG: thioredoxin family protein [Spirochaetaceae bacterium]